MEEDFKRHVLVTKGDTEPSGATSSGGGYCVGSSGESSKRKRLSLKSSFQTDGQSEGGQEDGGGDGNKGAEKETIISSDPSAVCDKCIKMGIRWGNDSLRSLDSEDALKLGYLEQSQMSSLCSTHRLQLVVNPKKRAAKKCCNPLSKFAHLASSRLKEVSFENILNIKRCIPKILNNITLNLFTFVGFSKMTFLFGVLSAVHVTYYFQKEFSWTLINNGWKQRKL